MERKYYTKSGKIEIKFKPLPDINCSYSLYEGFKPGSTVFPKGTVFRKGYAPIPCDILQERDVDFTLSDGTTIYCDIYRPLTNEKVPIILCWGPAGKSGIRDMLEGRPNRCNVPKSRLSGMQGWECADPAHWVPYNYAVIQVDPRGAYMSQGDVQMFGDLDAHDAYEFIEWITQAEWCNGKLGMSGNSWYSMVQLYIGALNPPHLTCLAPWEGQNDLYRREYMRGGIPGGDLPGARCWSNGGRIEAMDIMEAEHPLIDEYWEEKRPHTENIKCPVYQVASYTNGTHTVGTLEAWRSFTMEEKWLRIHNIMEWGDYYKEENLEDLRKFFDHYLKGIDNGWEKTPTVRMATLDPGHPPLGYRAEKAFPLERQQVNTLYLNACGGALQSAKPEKEAAVDYNSEDPGDFAYFRCTAQEDMEITGYCKVKLWLEADGSDDMDIHVNFAKLDSDGNYLYHDTTEYLAKGPREQLRVSHRALDPEKSTELIPFQSHRKEELLSPGEIVPVEISLSPISMLVHKGETMEVCVSGFDQAMGHSGPPPMGSPQEMRAAMIMLGADPDKKPEPPKSYSRNKGRHIVHTGGKYDSLFMFPVIPGGRK